jgi:hypothetical protein
VRVPVLVVIVAVFYASAALASGGAAVVERFVDAFNRHDIDGMLELTTGDVRWMSLSDQQASVETSTQAELRDAMTSYFATTPSARARIRHITESGPFVHTVEEALWRAADGAEKSQCSMAVYELSEHRIRNVWYFRAFNCP